MYGVVLAAHGEVALALLKAAEAIVGGLDHVKAVSLEAGADPEQLRTQLTEAIREVDTGEGVLVLCDMFGGTPSNVCLSCELGIPVAVVTGVNLPMLIKATSTQQTPLDDAATMIVQYGQRHIANATQILRDRRAATERSVAVERAKAGDAAAAPR